MNALLSHKSSFLSFFITIVLLGFASTSVNAVDSPSPKNDFSTFVDVVSPLWNAIAERDEAIILTFLTHPDAKVRETALRGLANMRMESVDQILDLALSQKEQLAWFTLSTQRLSPDILRRIEAFIDENQSNSASEDHIAGAYLVLGLQGDNLTHAFLTQILENDDSIVAPYAYALALSRSSLRTPRTEEQQFLTLKRAIQAKSSMEQAAWMYAWYRSPSITIGDRTRNGLFEWAQAWWDEAPGITRQYWIQILGKHHDPRIMDLLTYDFMRDSHPLEGVEAARTIFRFARSAERRPVDFKPVVSEEVITQKLVALLMHDSEMVRLEVLMALSDGNFDIPLCIQEELYMSLTENHDLSSEEWMWRVQALARCSQERAREVMEEYPRQWSDNPHLVTNYINTLRAVYIPDDVIDQLNSLADEANEAILVNVVQQITDITMEEPENYEIRAIVAQILRKVATRDSDRLSIALSQSNAMVEWTADQRDARLLAHIERGDAIRDISPDGLLKPDPDVLKTLGSHPTWIITTKEGDLTIRLDAIRNPATVTALAEITLNGWHNESPFHRVVHNFVIQGGALWTGPYPGSPNFRVPTEATELEFVRGAVGVASSGRDTEGSQFFVMHMWHPHLNGGYSNIGYVTSGIEILDAINQGSRILETRMVP
jgi:cyclophilin family peptidyl-prolyl cis-trans isomerase